MSARRFNIHFSNARGEFNVLGIIVEDEVGTAQEVQRDIEEDPQILMLLIEPLLQEKWENLTVVEVLT